MAHALSTVNKEVLWTPTIRCGFIWLIVVQDISGLAIKHCPSGGGGWVSVTQRENIVMVPLSCGPPLEAMPTPITTPTAP